MNTPLTALLTAGTTFVATSMIILLAMGETRALAPSGKYGRLLLGLAWVLSGLAGILVMVAAGEWG